MNAQPSLFSYRSIVSAIHRVPAGVKLACMIAATIAAFSGSIVVLGGITAAIALAAALAKTRPASIFGNFRIILFYGLFIVVFRFVGVRIDRAIVETGLVESGIYLWQLTVVLFAGTVFYETTSTLEILHTLAAIQQRIGWVFSPFIRLFQRITGREPGFPDVAFLLSLTISFIPRVFAAWTDLDRAWAARGGTIHRGLRATFRRITLLVPMLIALLLAVAADTERAIRNRSE
jgi:energy-coupling factor transporter transmembrane protein EcfT